MIASIGNEDIFYTGKVIDKVNENGYYVDVKGQTCFMPGSMASLNKLEDFDELLNEDVIISVVNYIKEKDSIIVSRKEYLKTLLPEKIDQLEEFQ